MKKFDRNKGRGFEKRSFGGRDRGGFGGRDNFSAKKEMFHAVCSECGEDCEVPFRPSGSKPVFCSSCFRGHDTAPEYNDRGGHARSRNNNSEMRSVAPVVDIKIEEKMNTVIAKLEKIINLLSANSAIITTPKSAKEEIEKVVPSAKEKKVKAVKTAKVAPKKAKTTKKTKK